MNNRLLDFEPSLFFKVLAATFGAVLLGWVGALWVFGELSGVDVVGSLISAPIFAYMVHLWIIYARDST